MREGLQLSETLQSQLDETCMALVVKAMSELEINRLKDLNVRGHRNFHRLVMERFELSLWGIEDRLLGQEEVE